MSLYAVPMSFCAATISFVPPRRRPRRRAGAPCGLADPPPVRRAGAAGHGDAGAVRTQLNNKYNHP